MKRKRVPQPRRRRRHGEQIVHLDEPLIEANSRLELPRDLRVQIEHVPVDELKAYRLNARKHPKKQLAALEKSMKTFGFVSPIVADSEGNVIAGHARLLGARRLGMTNVPVVRLNHLSPAQVRALRIADNRLTELAEWDQETLAIELQSLVEIDFDVELTGFEMPEIDFIISEQLDSVPSSPADSLPEIDNAAPPISVLGDKWELGDHRIVCGDARDPADYAILLGPDIAEMVFTDPPYNVRIDGNVCGSGQIHHEEFIMASGEISDVEFSDFLGAVAKNLVQCTTDGSLHFWFMDWRHLAQLADACGRHYTDLVNICIWAKTNAGMGSLYRSQHEMIPIFKNGTAPHINNVQLGKYGRNRTNVWFYEGVNTLNPDRRAELALHPTVKPVALVKDAIRDCSNRGDIVLDPFLGSGTTILAAEQAGRRGYGLELDPRYVDVAIRRWQAFTGEEARHAGVGLTFSEVAAARLSPVPLLPPPTPVREGS